ncbi:MAG: potassium transporter [Spirochaetae bacterium HGW-Spirochaetae-5]|nr:MAG: potassium transporter [Spirochaetae bacterium HGW-Spirochaetae-5]
MHPGIVLRTLSYILLIIAGCMIMPAAIAVINGEKNEFFAIVLSAGIAVVIFFIIKFFSRGSDSETLSTRDGFLFVTLSWITASLIGALPYYISGAIPSFTDAYFETMSGFTTTGASILTQIEILPQSLLFWRSLTHWLGGMGIVVLTVAILPALGIGGLQLINAEAPGPTVDKLTPRIAETAKILWFIYLGLTVLETILLMFGGMNLFDALTHTFGTVATGGYSTKNTSVAYYNSAYIDGVITLFMVLAGINFSLHFWLLRGKFENLLKDSELKGYLAIFSISTLIITWNVSGTTYNSIGESFRFASFQVASILTTTGFATADYEKWPFMSQAVLFILMFVGGCSGSTGGGIKVLRLITLLKQGINEMKYLIHPRGVFTLRINRRPVKKDIVYGISGFFFLYILMLLITTFIAASSGADVETSFTSALATLGNIGPGFGKVGPTDNFAFFPAYVKWWFSFAMLAGRLELYTVLILFTTVFWKK